MRQPNSTGSNIQYVYYFFIVINKAIEKYRNYDDAEHRGEKHENMPAHSLWHNDREMFEQLPLGE